MRAAFAVWAAAALLLLGCEAAAPQPAAATAPAPASTPPAAPVAAAPTPSFFAGPPDGKLHLYFFDVGQGDATLIVSPTGTTALIDGGDLRTSTHLVHRLPELLRDTPDFIVLTDPKPEHVGGLVDVLAAFGAKRFLDPGLPSPAPAYQALLAALQARQVLHIPPTPDPQAPDTPVRYELGGGAALEVFWPRAPVEPPLAAGDAFPDANALVMRLEYGHTSVLLASDMTADTEHAVLAKRLVRSTLLKVADHGSDRASTPEFLAAVAPRAMIVTSGPGPRDGLPSPEMLARAEAVHAHVFRTDLDGEIHAVSDGDTFTVTAERPAAGEATGTPHVYADTVVSEAGVATSPEAASDPSRRGSDAADRDATSPRALPKNVRFVASRKSRVFHLPTCRNAQRIKPDNLLTFKSRAEAMKHFKPASDCHP